MSDYQAEGGQADATENLLQMYNGGIRVGQGTVVEWDHRVVIVCRSAFKKRALAVKYGADKKRVRCPRCRRWAALTVLELPPDEL